jgi:hypothetical protein
VAAGLDRGTDAEDWPVGLGGPRGVRGGHPVTAREGLGFRGAGAVMDKVSRAWARPFC